MENNKLIFSTIEISELLKLIREAQNTESSQQVNSKNSQKYLTRAQVAEMLKISLPTLGKYVKDGSIPCYRIGNRILFNPDEVVESLDRVQSLNISKYR